MSLRDRIEAREEEELEMKLGSDKEIKVEKGKKKKNERK